MPRAKTPRTATTTTRTKLATPKFQDVEAPRQESTRNRDGVDLHAEISRRAYELYQERGCVPALSKKTGSLPNGKSWRVTACRRSSHKPAPEDRCAFYPVGRSPAE